MITITNCLIILSLALLIHAETSILDFSSSGKQFPSCTNIFTANSQLNLYICGDTLKVMKNSLEIQELNPSN